MELQEIVDRYAEAAEYIDVDTEEERANPRTGEVYHVSFKSLSETRAVDAIDAMWSLLHPGELLTPAANRIGVRYPAVARARCDHVFSVEPRDREDREEWGLEVKKIEFIGNNGNRNDFGVGKMLSPYLKDRGLLHDAVRLRQNGFTRRVGVIGYSFAYDLASCEEALDRHPDSAATIANMRAVVRSNGGHLYPRPLIEFTDAILGMRGYSRGPRVEAAFTAFRSPTGGRGLFFGWEIRRPWLEPDYDERHPW